MTDVALRHRVPNPPPVFVGRGGEVDRLRAMIERGPVSVVWGLGGLGKSALVSEVLRRHFANELSRAVLVGMRPGDSVDQLRSELLAALVRVNGLDPEEGGLGESARDPEAMVATLIDLAERQKVFVVLEDLHNGDFESVSSLLGAIARYARDSRWIVATRHDPRLEGIAEQALALPAMSDADLIALATSVGGADGATEAVVRGARGSPWRLRQLVAGARLDDEEDLFVHVSEAARRLLDVMVHLDLPLPPEVLARLAPLPSGDELALLERRGMIERSARGLRLHDVARSVLSARSKQGIEREPVARALSTVADPAAVIEALRLHLAARDFPAALELLRAHHHDLVHAGFAPRLWDLLEATADARFDSIRRHVAVALRTDHAVAWAAAQPAPEELSDRLAWVRALSLRSDSASAARAADTLRDDAARAGEEGIRFEAMLLGARARYAGGRPQEAVETLRGYGTSDEVRAARRDAMLARCLSAVGAYAEALAIVDALASFEARSDVGGAQGAYREVQQHRAAVLFSAGRLRATSEVLARGGSELSTSPRTILRRMHLAIEGGDLRGGLAARASLGRFARLLPVERMHSLTMWCRLGLALGELDDVQRSADECLAIATEGGNARLYYWTRVIRLAAAIAQGQEAPRLSWPANIPKPSGATAAWLATFERAYALRRRRPVPASARVDIPDIVNLKVLALHTDAEEALIGGDHELALRKITASLQLAREHGWMIHEADGLRLHAEILACAGRFEEAERRATELAELAEKMASPRYVEEAKLMALFGKPGPDAAVICSVARAIAYAPEAGRRARRLLGLEASIDALDELVVAAATKRWPDVRIECVAVEDDVPRWGLDFVAREAHLEGGEVVSLKRHAVMLRMLELCVIAGGGPITKERLARDVWEVAKYHPHRDDARIEMAVSRLRKMLDGDKATAHVLTSGEGYALAGPCWIVRTRA